jgi:hypothetical protein
MEMPPAMNCSRYITDRTVENSLKRLHSSFRKNKQMKRLIITEEESIAGDLFDTALLFTQDEVSIIQGWMCRLMDFCSRYNIKLRILEGTPSHDNFQCRNLVCMAEQFSHKLDFKYIETLHIEKMEDIHLSVLYVPDEWSATTKQTQEQVSQLLKEASLAKVDIAIMHGMFTYQVPELANNALKHDEIFYLNTTIQPQ